MSWLLSTFIVGFIFANPYFSTENLAVNTTPQVVVSTPQAVLQGDETEKFEQTYPLNANGRISVDNVNGSITVDAWDKNEVRLEAVKIANSRERLAEVEIKVDAKPDSLRISTEFGRNRNWNCSGYCRLEVQYKLTVPRGAVLSEIETVNGSVTIANMTNFTKASAVNGSVKAANLRGTAHIETVNGTSEVSFERLDSSSKINLSTVNGRVNLLIPSDSDATIKAESVNGIITNDFNIPVRKGKYVGRDLYGKLGDGSVAINLESVNGGLNIKRQADGKNPKSVTNLLNMSEDAEDDEDSVSVATSVGKINKEVSKAVKESAKISVKESMKIAEKALKDNAGEIERAQREAEQAQREAEREIRNAQRDIERAQREGERVGREIARAYGQAFGANWGGFGASRIEEKTDSFPVKGTPKVTVDAKNCNVTVRGWDKDEVKYRVTKLVRGAGQPNINVTTNNTESDVTIKANVIKSTTQNDEERISLPENSVRIEVFVPKKSNLRILTDREIRVEGISGSIDLSGNEGAINVRDSDGKLKITAADAMVRVIGFTGELDSQTSDGANFFEGDFAKFNAKTVDGKIILTLPEGSNVDFQTATEIQTEGFDLNESGAENTYRIGKGGKIFNLKTDGGEIFVRNAKVLNARD
jgi:hypothetical protein